MYFGLRRSLRSKDASLLKEMRVILSKLELLIISEESERIFPCINKLAKTEL